MDEEQLNIQKIAEDIYGINTKLLQLSKSITEEIRPFLDEIDDIVEYNQVKVISAMNESFLSDYHLTDSTGYGYNDTGSEAIDNIYKTVFKSEDALVRPQIVSGTHAIALCLLAVLRPGDELLSITGAPYDTLSNVIFGENCGSLKDYNIKYKETNIFDCKNDYNLIMKKIKEKVSNNTKMVLIQRSRGYALRPSLSIGEIEKLIKYVKSIKQDVICFVDNCYGEFVEKREPIEVGADLCAGSLIKNPGGGIAPTGGYIVGKAELVKQCNFKLTAPGLDKSCGASLFTNRLILQGLFYAPMVVGEALKGAIFTSKIMEQVGIETYPKYNEKRGDIVTAVILNNKDALIQFCRSIQKVGPVDSHVKPEPWAMPGYNHKVIMAGGSFIQGSSIELSADAPIREPFVAYIQGGINFAHVKLGVLSGLQSLISNGYLKI